jgi:uncharacterized membrane protein
MFMCRCLELGHTTAIICEVYRTTIIFWGRVEEVARFPALGVAVLLGGFITTLVQVRIVYTHRERAQSNDIVPSFSSSRPSSFSHIAYISSCQNHTTMLGLGLR